MTSYNDVRPILTASQAIDKLKQLIEQHGDCELCIMTVEGRENGIEFITARKTVFTKFLVS